MLGLSRRYGVDLAEAEARFFELSRQVHPDRFTKADPRARRASLQRSVQVNEAWRTIKDEVGRAEYLLRLAGFDLGAEERVSRPAAAEAVAARRAREPIKASTELLAEILDWREELAAAREAHDEERVQRLATDMRGRIQKALERVAESFARLDSGEIAQRDGDDELGAAARELIAVRYYRRFLDEVSAHDEATDARHQGPAHA